VSEYEPTDLRQGATYTGPAPFVVAVEGLQRAAEQVLVYGLDDRRRVALREALRRLDEAGS
jgi:hypothetical protein